MSGALQGITIIDLCRDMPGSYACMLLGDMGAEVVKIEPVDGDPARSEPVFRHWNRGRKSLAVDIQVTEGRDILAKLIARSDVLIETFLARETRELGVDYETVNAINPGLIYCAMPPFGDSGPLSDLPADEGVVSAHAGMYADQGGEGSPPLFVGLPVVSYGAAFMAAFAVSSALYTREMDGLGQKVEVPWYGGGTALQAGQIVTGPNIVNSSRSARNQQGSNPIYRLYRCQDDWLFVACGNATFWNKLCIALGVEHLVEDPRYADAPWNIPAEHHGDLSSLIGEALAKRPRAHWLEYLAAHDVPCAPAGTREDFAKHPQVLHNKMLVDVPDPDLGLTRQIGVPVNLYETPWEPGMPAPRVGQDTGDLLSGLGYSAQRLETLAEQDVIGLDGTGGQNRIGSP